MPRLPLRRRRKRSAPTVLTVGATEAVAVPINAPRTLHGVPNAVVIDYASVQFPDQLAVDRIRVTVQSGTILGLIGPSGAGKTTTIRLLTGAVEPTAGSVTVLTLVFSWLILRRGMTPA